MPRERFKLPRALKHELIELLLLRNQLLLHPILLVQLNAEIAEQQQEQHDIQRTQRAHAERGNALIGAARVECGLRPAFFIETELGEGAVEAIGARVGLRSGARSQSYADPRVEGRANRIVTRERGVVRLA